MLDADKFLPDILANPDDDAPRLVYADWLTEHGDPRGELIHVQCEIPNCAKQSQLRKLKQREKELLRAFRNKWFADVVKLSARSPEFRRGFVDEITISVRDFIRNGKEILACTPLTRAKLTAGANRMKKLAELEPLRCLRHLELSRNHMGPKNLGYLLESPYLINLRSLILRTCELGEDGARLLGNCSELSNLNSLDLGNNQIESGLDYLANSEYLEKLTDVNLATNRLGNQAGNTLANARWQRLKRLDVYGNQMAPFGSHSIVAESLSKSRRLKELEHLDLSFCSIGEQGIQAIASSNAFPELRTLVLNGNTIGNNGALSLAESEFLSQLTDLRLSQCNLKMKGIKALLDSPNWNPKTKLYLGKTRLSDSEIRKIKQEYGKTFGMEESDAWLRKLRR